MNDRSSPIPLPGTIVQDKDGRPTCVFMGQLHEPFVCPSCTGIHITIAGDGWVASATVNPQLAAEMAAKITMLLPTSRLPS